MKLTSFFSGAGGLDRGFENAGFKVLYANEYDKTIWATYRHNFPHTKLDERSIVDIEVEEVADCDGMIGGPPCQSWSEAGSLRGIEDARGQLFFEYIRILEGKRPLFFLAENVSGILFNRHRGAFESILVNFAKLGYNVSYGLLNANNFKQALSDLKVIDSEFKNNADVNNLLGYSSRKLKQYKPAATYYEKALKLNPNHLGALEYQGELFVLTNKVSAAKKNLVKLEKLCGLKCGEYLDLKKAIGKK